MREIMIRFRDDGEVFREIDENRNYFLNEAESIVEKIRVRLKNEKRVANPKEYECWIDNTRLIITHIRFENELSLEKQLEKTILEHDSWDEDMKHRYVNLLKEYASKERELLVHKHFRAFVIRCDQYLGSNSIEPFPLLLSLEAMKELFDVLFVNVKTGFYSELERIMESIHKAYQTIVSDIYNHLLTLDSNKYEGSIFDYLKVRVTTWLRNEENFNRFKNYVSSCYQSVPETRITALYPKFEPYQNLQKSLFLKYAERYSFDDAYKINTELHKAFHKKYNDVLFEGFVLKTDEMIESLILIPVVKEYYQKMMMQMVDEQEERERGDITDEFQKAVVQ